MPSDRQPVRFGLFEVNLDTGDVRRAGVKVRMQEQPFQVLAALLEKPGEIVTKEELQERIWKDDTFVDFDRSLATAINKVRQALGDSATRPRFIETVAKRGYRFIGAAGQLGPAAEEPGDGLPPGEVGIRRNTLIALQVLAAALGIALLALAFVHFAQAPSAVPKQPVRRFSITTPANLDVSQAAGPIISPNGKHVAFTTAGADGRLWVQDLDQDEPRELAGTDGAAGPFWSPDSEYIAFRAGVDLRKISVRGGTSGLICPLPQPIFTLGAWSPDGESIVFSAGSPNTGGVLYEVPSEGGAPTQLLAPSDFPQGNALDWILRPNFLPRESGRILLFSYWVSELGTATIYARNLDTGQTEELGPGDYPVYSASSGLLIYISDSWVFDLWARPFSPETLQFSGPGFPLRQNARQPSVSDDGTLAYLDGAAAFAQTLLWRNRTGELLAIVGQSQPLLSGPALSPDGQYVVVSGSNESGNSGIWVHDLIRSTKTRLTFDAGSERTAAWSPSGDEIVYWLLGADGSSLMRKAADGTGEAVVLVEAKDYLTAPDWSRDGRYLVYEERTADGNYDIRYLQFASDGAVSEPVTFLATSAAEEVPKLSPDGRFLAYESDESGRSEIYVRPFPSGGGKWQASVDGGTAPRWRGDGRELYYARGGNTLMAVSVSTGSAFTLGQPQPLFEAPGLVRAGSLGDYDVSADGQRFLTVAPVEGTDAELPKIRIVENWYEEFRDRVQ